VRAVTAPTSLPAICFGRSVCESNSVSEANRRDSFGQLAPQEFAFDKSRLKEAALFAAGAAAPLRGNQKVLEFVRNAQRKLMLCLQVYALHDIAGHLGYTKIDGLLKSCRSGSDRVVDRTEIPSGHSAGEGFKSAIQS
jgi:hypothetical protein